MGGETGEGADARGDIGGWEGESDKGCGLRKGADGGIWEGRRECDEEFGWNGRSGVGEEKRDGALWAVELGGEWGRPGPCQGLTGLALLPSPDSGCQLSRPPSAPVPSQDQDQRVLHLLVSAHFSGGVWGAGLAHGRAG